MLCLAVAVADLVGNSTEVRGCQLSHVRNALQHAAPPAAAQALLAPKPTGAAWRSPAGNANQNDDVEGDKGSAALTRPVAMLCSQPW